MKSKIIAAFITMMVTAPAFAGYAGPLIVKTSGGGYMHPDWVRSEKCELYLDKVVITKNFGHEHAMKETRKIELSGDLFSLIEQAATETVSLEDNYMCDGPSTGIYAVQILPTDETENLPLFSTGGCGSPTKTRVGVYSSKLVDMVSVYCPKTYLNPNQ